jgi:hypothetical protein
MNGAYGSVKYKIKMILPAICWGTASTAFLLLCLLCLCFQNTFAAIICFMTGVIFYLITIQIPRPFFRIRLNEYFVIIRYPFTKWQGVFQSPDPKWRFRSHEIKQCKKTLCRVSHQMTDMFSSIYFETGGSYRLTTHQTVVNHLKRLEKSEQIKIVTCIPIYRHSLKKEQQKILGRSCRCCSDRKVCRWYQGAIKRRQFYYVEFQVIR